MRQRLGSISKALFCVFTVSTAMLSCGSDDPGLRVASVEPAAHSNTVAAGAILVVEFNEAVDPGSIRADSVRIFGQWSGPAAWSASVSEDQRRVELTPARSFSSGESVSVFLSRDVRSQEGDHRLDGGYAFRFRTRAMPSAMTFRSVGQLSLRSDSNVGTRVYGGQASDLNGDGWLDLSIINEDSGDLRVLLNPADGSGVFREFLKPPTVVGNVPSPNEPADFNNDGHVDICAANKGGNSVSILLGNGDGTFQPAQVVPVGANPAGLAVLDADGDGDLDVATANFESNDLSLLLNDGTGHFGAARSLDGGGNGEYALAAADMDNDGIEDLVVGARESGEILIHRGQGDGTFRLTSATPAGGAVWMLVTGDVNGDGHLDVATANSRSNNGAILLGRGDGSLEDPQILSAADFPLATDLGDLDGDGDLDWILSSFTGQSWNLYTNDGAGRFTRERDFAALSNPACSILFDSDNDGDLDLALLEETADLLVLMRNEN